jgi:hypothetical protein
MAFEDVTKSIIDKLTTIYNTLVLLAGSITGKETVSRTIYVATTGNDITGDGTVLNPFATLLKALQTVKNTINQNITITIHLASGSYTYDNYAMEGEFKRIALLETAVISIESDMVLVVNGFTLTAHSPEAFIYTVTGIVPILNAYQDKFLLVGSEYHPISHNTVTDLYTNIGNAAGTSIYEPAATLNMTNKFFDVGSDYTQGGDQSVNFKHLKISLADFLILGFSSQVSLFECSLSTVAFQFEYKSKVLLSVERCIFICSNAAFGVQLKLSTGSTFKQNVIRKSGAKAGIGLNVLTGNNISINGLYLYNFTDGIAVSPANVYFEANKSYLIVDDCTDAILIDNGAVISMPRTSIAVYIYLVTYFIKERLSTNTLFGNYVVQFSSIIGTPATNWLTANVWANGFVNLSKNISITIPTINTSGIAVLVGGTVTVNTVAVTANSKIILTNSLIGGTIGILSIGVITPGVNFVINSSNILDTSSVTWQIIG